MNKDTRRSIFIFYFSTCISYTFLKVLIVPEIKSLRWMSQLSIVELSSRYVNKDTRHSILIFFFYFSTCISYTFLK